jgi:hypothetical protein
VTISLQAKEWPFVIIFFVMVSIATLGVAWQGTSPVTAFIMTITGLVFALIIMKLGFQVRHVKLAVFYITKFVVNRTTVGV